MLLCKKGEDIAIREGLVLVFSLSHPLTKFVGTPINEHPTPTSVCHTPAPTKAYQSPPVFILLRVSASSWGDSKGGENTDRVT